MIGFLAAYFSGAALGVALWAANYQRLVSRWIRDRCPGPGAPTVASALQVQAASPAGEAVTRANGLATRPFAQSLKTAWWQAHIGRQWRRYRIQQAAQRVHAEMAGAK